MQVHTDGVELYYAKDREECRKWLQINHTIKKAIWLIYYKAGSGKTRVSYNDVVDEAICFGWIDSKLDDERSIQFFAPRNPKSNWSKLNKERVERLIAENRMTPAGMTSITIAKANGTWQALDEVEAFKIPNDLLVAFNSNPVALSYFEKFPKSSKKNILEWIHNVKQLETRQKRIEETVRLASENIRANHYRQPKSKL